MLSESQRKEIEFKTLRCVALFIKLNLSDKEIEKKTGIPSSSVGRYLTDKRMIEILNEYDYDGQQIFDQIQNLRKQNLLEAKKKGGQNFAKNNIAIKDEVGQFKGSIKK